MQFNRHHRSQPFAARVFRLGKRLWVLSCIAFFFSLLAASSVAKPVYAAHHPHRAASAFTQAAQWIDQASESAVFSDWENDSDEWEESFVPVEGPSGSSAGEEIFVPLKAAGRSQPFSPSVPLFVLFHAWKDHLS